jgi:hypothetical protein
MQKISKMVWTVHTFISDVTAACLGCLRPCLCCDDGIPLLAQNNSGGSLLLVSHVLCSSFLQVSALCSVVRFACCLTAAGKYLPL